MLRNNAFGFVILFAMAGCAQTRVQPVFVDLDRILKSENQREGVVIASPPPADHVSGANKGLPQEPMRKIVGSNTLARRKEIEELIASNRRDAEADLSSRLRQAYQNEVALAESDLLTKHATLSRERLEVALGGLRPIFDSYARKRSPKVVRLSLLAGFPDSDPQSTRKRTGAMNTARLAEEAKSLRAELAVIQSEYELAAQAYISSADVVLSEALIAIRLDIEARRVAADQRAKKEATDLVLKQTSTLDDVAMGQTAIEFAPSKAEAPKFVASDPVIFGSPGALGSSDVKMKRRQALVLEAEIWAATNGFKLSDSRTSPERTLEFLKWRQKHRAGP